MSRKRDIATRLEAVKHDCTPLHGITLIAVSKGRPLEDIQCAYECGQRDFGENRVLELKEKAISLQDQGLAGICWHFIGRLQSNKMATLLGVPSLTAIHSVDRLELLSKLYAKAHALTCPLDYFLQINTSGEEEKAGLESVERDKAEWEGIAHLISTQQNSPLRLNGLMTLSKIRTQNFEADARACFEKLCRERALLQKNFNFPDLKLSMGMSADYPWAIAAGSDYIRVGSAIFGP